MVHSKVANTTFCMCVGVYMHVCVSTTWWNSCILNSKGIHFTSPHYDKYKPPVHDTFLYGRNISAHHRSWWSLQIIVSDWVMTLAKTHWCWSVCVEQRKGRSFKYLAISLEHHGIAAQQLRLMNYSRRLNVSQVGNGRIQWAHLHGSHA